MKIDGFLIPEGAFFMVRRPLGLI
jgi:hypothetical protein